MPRTTLSLELVCGASDAPTDHPGHWHGPTDDGYYHPGQMRVRELASRHGIRVDLQAHLDNGVWYSDGYVRFLPRQGKLVARILKDAGHPGDILDVYGPVSPAIESLARQNGWLIETPEF